MIGFFQARLTGAKAILRLALIFLMVISALISAGVLGWRQLRGEVGDRAQAEADSAVVAVSDHLREADKVFGPLARAEAGALRAEALSLGRPTLDASSPVALPILKFGRRVANDDNALVDAITDRMGGEATAYVVSPLGLTPVATSVKGRDGSRAYDRSLGADGDAYGAVRSGHAYTGPITTTGQTYFAHLEPILDDKDRVIGAFGIQFSDESLEETAREIIRSSLFAHGFLAVIDPSGRVLFRSANIDPDWITRHGASLSRAAAGAHETVGDYRLSRSMNAGQGPRVVIGVYEPDLTLQAIRLEGVSLGFLALVISLALSLAWLMARRLTAALDAARRSRAEAEAAKAAAEAAGAALSAELEQAARYVESLLPQRASHGLVATDWLYRPSAGVGGDAFGYHWLDETHFAVFLLDVCGHGVGAALLATTVMNVIRARTVTGADFLAPDSVLSALNAAFPMEAQNGMYFTIWYGVYDTVTQTMTFASAGHHPAVLVAPDAPPRLLRGKGLPIGCFDEVKYPVFSMAIPAGARLYIFSDGIFEVGLPNSEEMFSFEEFVNIILEWRENNTKENLLFVLQAMQSVQGRANFDDDCALVEVEFRRPQKLELVA